MERITDKYVFFWGSEFSNWFSCDFNYKEHVFHNSEQAFMWEKALAFKDDEIADLILKTPNPRTNKELGRQVKGFDQNIWNQTAFTIMVAVNYAKFNQNPELQKLLLSTGDKTIVEASPTDNIWGIGLHWSDDKCLDEANWNGQNLLGKALMEVRGLII